MDKLKQFHAYATERAVKTFAQTALGVITASAALSIIDINFVEVLGVSALATLMSLLTSVLQYDRKPMSE
jgi:anti-anti-sigma regulatory factor